MCLIESRITNLEPVNSPNWDGDIIVQSSTVPSSRPIVGHKKHYGIDVREFVANEDNSSMKKILREDVERFIKGRRGESVDLFKSRRLTSFDYRVQVIQDFVSETVRYARRRGDDPWQFPEETYALKSGDCEDRAFLIASLMRASGVSPFNVRLALGKVRLSRNGSIDEYDHLWVMYKNELGRWVLIEPLNQKDLPDAHLSEYRRRHKVRFASDTVTAEYLPGFLFNDRHLWVVKGPHLDTGFRHEIALRRSWKKFHPKFAGEVHQTIINASLAGLDPAILNRLNRYYNRAVKGLVGPIIDEVDRGPYDPREHFDNSMIEEGWRLVAERLARFREGNEASLDDFAYAAHAIADFYAHTSYVHFARIVQTIDLFGDYAALYDPTSPDFKRVPDYSRGSDFDLTGEKFTANTYYWKKSRPEIAREWKGKILSGRYAQKHDTWPDLISQVITEGPTTIPQAILNTAGFEKAAGPPHHMEIAVDDAKKKGQHRLYLDGAPAGRDDGMNFANQFRWRKNAAIRHIRKVFLENWTSPVSLIPFAD